MTKEETLRDDMRRGNAASSLLENEAFQLACEQIEGEQTRIAIFETDERKRDVARAIVLGLHEIKRKLRKIEEGGHTAKKVIEHRANG